MASLGIVAGFARFSFIVALPEMTQDIFGSYSTAGLVLGVNFTFYLLAVMIVRRTAGSVDPSLIVKLGLCLAVVGMTITALAPTTPVAVLGSALLGLGSGGGFIPVTTIIVSVAPPQRRGLAMGLGLAGIGLSIVLTGQIISVFEHLGAGAPWRAAFAAEAALGTMTLALAAIYLPRLRPTAVSTEPTKGVMNRLPGSWALLTCYGLFGFAVSTYTGFLVSALKDDRGFTSVHAILVSSLLGGAMSVAVVIGRISDKIGRKRTIVTSIAVLALCALVVPWGTSSQISFSAILAGLLINGVGAVVGAYLGDHLTTTDVTSAMGILTLAMAIVQIIAPPIGGFIVDATGSFTATFVLAAALAVVAVLAGTRLPGDDRRLDMTVVPEADP